MKFNKLASLLFTLVHTVGALHARQPVQAGTAAQAAQQLTVRTAKATVINQTGKVMRGVTLVHKYSDIYVNNITWPDIKQGVTGSPTVDVRYHTGFLTTGRDWWLVSWIGEDGRTLYHTDPANGQCFFNFLERLAPSILPSVAGAIVDYIAKDTADAGKIASDTVSLLMKPLFNKGDTCGFKQHILESKDDGKLVTITLQADGKAVINSPSGRSETVWKADKL